ncbi:MAG: inorganic phosphate transporter [ANME-2 cluster archaeon]|nr:inorganic phosphate transporter [ANME-2 cluster archaeon]
MEIFDPLMLAVLIAGLYMAWNIGANDLANSMGTSVGSGALSIKQVIVIAGTLELVGALFFGERVTSRIAKGIVPIDQIMAVDPNIVIMGSLAAILAAGFWITFATFYHMPVSTTHSIVGAVTGFGIVTTYYLDSFTLDQIEWLVLAKIVISWITSPLLGAAIAFIIFTLIRFLLLGKVSDPYGLEKKFVYMQILSACFVAFAHGSNDVANAVGPISAALAAADIIPYGTISVWVLAIGGLGIILGLATWGWKVIETIGKGITELTPTRGFSAEFATALVVFGHSYSSLPISTTHTLVGAVVGVGLAGGLAAVDLSVIRKIIVSWVITVPVAALTSGILFAVLMEVL